jgi:RNA polymerase sigma-70 factor (ECF subfamily)
MGSPIPPGAAGDRELWLRAGEGDTAAFGELFGRHANAVYNHLFRRVADWSEAEDLTSAVFLQAWRTRGRVVIDRESALPWLLGVANHVLRNHRRASRRYRDALRTGLGGGSRPASARTADHRSGRSRPAAPARMCPEEDA